MKTIVGVVLIILSVYSLYACFKGKEEAGVVFISDSFFLRKLFGKNFKYVFNFTIGVIELFFGLAILLGKL